MHNNIMAARSKDRPPMLGPGRYAQWKCILEGPYKATRVVIEAVEATENSLAVPQHEEVEIVHNTSAENKPYFQAEKEAIFLILTGIGNEIYSTIDACKTASEMKFTSQDRESMESYYYRFYRMMNELTRNNLQVTTIQVNVQFLQQLQPEWSRFVTIVKQSEYIDTVSYHKLFDILKRYQKEVNEIRAERIAKTPKQSFSISSSTSTRHRGKEIAKLVTPLSESVSDEDSDPEQAQKDKEMQKNLTLIAKYFKKPYKPTKNNLRTSSNSKNKTEDNPLRYKNDNQSGQFRNQRTMTVAGARETIGSQVVQKNGIQCFNCKEYGHFAKECKKPKRVKDFTYHKEKMLLCKQAETGVPLQVEQADWLKDTDEEINEQELEAHYSFMANIKERQHSEQPECINDTHVLENDDSDVTPDLSNMCKNDNQVDQNATECADERAVLANLIANLTLDTEENKNILKQLKKANASLTQELKECNSKLEESNRALGESTSTQDNCLIALQNKQTELEKYKAINDGTLVKKSLLTKSQFEGLLKEKSKVISDLKVKEGKDIDKMIEMDKQIKFLDRNSFINAINLNLDHSYDIHQKCATYNGRSTFANLKYLKKAQSENPCLYEIPYDTSDPTNRFASDREETVTLANESRSKLNKVKVKPYNYTNQNSLYEIFKPPSQEYLCQLDRAKAVRKTMWRKTFVRTKPDISKNIAFLPVSKSISKSRQAYNDMTNNINHFRTIVDLAWFKHTSDSFRDPTALDMEVLIKS
ncbi:retrovirus-related pol polyprotein from transposon TNT 1-94 [Tanacetum coccineum]